MYYNHNVLFFFKKKKKKKKKKIYVNYLLITYNEVNYNTDVGLISEIWKINP